MKLDGHLKTVSAVIFLGLMAVLAASVLAGIMGWGI